MAGESGVVRRTIRQRGLTRGGGFWANGREKGDTPQSRGGGGATRKQAEPEMKKGRGGEFVIVKGGKGGGIRGYGETRDPTWEKQKKKTKSLKEDQFIKERPLWGERRDWTTSTESNLKVPGQR